MMTNVKITFSLKTILVILLAVIGLYLAVELRGVLLTVFIAYIINAGLRPVIDWLERRKIKRGIGILITYLALFFILILLSSLVFSVAFNQIRSFFDDIDFKVSNFINFAQVNLPFLNQFIDYNNLSASLSNVSSVVSNFNINDLNQILTPIINFAGGRGLSLLGGVVGIMFNSIIIFMLSAYMLAQKDHVYKPLIKLVPDKWEKRVDPLLDKIESSLGSWFAGQLALMFIIGLLTYLIISIPGLFIADYALAPYALVIAIIAGLLEGVPSIGPILTLVFALIITILAGGGIPLLVYILISFVLLQQIEGIAIVPAVMKSAVDLHPILSIVAVVAGLELGGPIGALLSIPIAAALQIVVLEVSKSYRKD